MNSHFRIRRDDGFALVEALAALVVVAMISLMIVEGLGVGRRVWERIDLQERRSDTIEAAQSLLRDRIEELFPATRYDIFPEDVDFEGGPDSLVFVASAPQSSRPTTLRRYTLGLNAAGELRLSSVSDADPTLASAGESRVLLTRVRALDVAYYGHDGAAGGPRWRSVWRLQPLPPELVRIRVTFEPSDTRAWPDLIVRPRASIDSACIVEVSLHHCRGRP